MLDALARSWLDLQCQMIPSARQGLVVLSQGDEGSFAPAALWPAGAGTDPALLDAARLALGRASTLVRPLDPSVPGSSGRVHLAFPLRVAGTAIGAVALEMDALDAVRRRGVEQLVEWGAAWLELLLRFQAASATARLATAVRVLAAGYQQQGFAAAATAVATELATLLSCDRVSVGVGRRDRVRVVALSHSARFDRRTNLLRAVEGAMAEALLGEETVVHPPAAGEAPVPAVAHQTLAREHGGAVCTVLLSDAARPFGALTFERGAEQPFDAATVELCEAVSALLGPMLADRRRAERGAWARLLGAVGGPLGRLLGRGHLRVKLAALALVAVVATGVLATGPFRVTAPARVEGAVQRALVAPYAGYLASAGAKAGDLVKAGDVLATLDDQDLALERRRLANEREELNKEYRRALAQLDHAESRIVQAQIAQAEARLALLDEQIAKTRLTAPFDGVVVEGDLRDRLGAPVERGEILFELAPLDAYRLVLEVDEHDVGEVAAGQRGRLLLAALPGETLAFAVERITGIAETADGRNCLRVEARLDQAPPQLRPGMEGVGKVEVGERRLLDVWSDGLVKRARLWLWAWGS